MESDHRKKTATTARKIMGHALLLQRSALTTATLLQDLPHAIPTEEEDGITIFQESAATDNVILAANFKLKPVQTDVKMEDAEHHLNLHLINLLQNLPWQILL